MFVANSLLRSAQQAGPRGSRVPAFRAVPTSKTLRLATLALITGACSGQIGGNSGPGGRPGGPGGSSATNPSGGSGGAGGSGNIGTGGSSGGNPAACAPGTGALPWQPTPLTREQYIHAAADLLGFDVRSLATFSDVSGRKFTPGVTMTSQQVEERLLTAEGIAAAAAAPARVAALLPCDPARLDEACAASFVDGFGQRAFRRPLDAGMRTQLRKLFDGGKAAGGAATAVEWLVAGVLQAPDFLYQLAAAPAGKAGAVVPLAPAALASRLSFFLWDSPPDADLLTAAGKGDLAKPEGMAAQVDRMLRDPRALRALDDYYGHFLKLHELEDVSREVPEFNPGLADGLRASALTGITALYKSRPTIEALLGDSAIYTEPALSGVYGPAKAGERRGILTHPALLAVLANPDASDPIKRGIFMMEELLCQVLPDPLPDIPDLPPLKPGLSTRARLEQHRADPVCAGCHNLIDPLGSAFENFDQIGRWRTMDQGVPVDSSGEVTQEIDLKGRFASGMEFLGKLPGSPAVRDCMTRRWAEYAYSRTLDGAQPADRCALESAQSRFRQNGDLVELLSVIANSETFRSTQVPGGNGP
jgi:hypothetical protein